MTTTDDSTDPLFAAMPLPWRADIDQEGSGSVLDARGFEVAEIHYTRVLDNYRHAILRPEVRGGLTYIAACGCKVLSDGMTGAAAVNCPACRRALAKEGRLP